MDTHEPYAVTVNNVVASRKLFAGSVDVSAAFIEGEQENKLYSWLPAELCEDNIPLKLKYYVIGMALSRPVRYGMINLIAY